LVVSEHFELRPRQYSIKIECKEKGGIQPSIKVYSDKADPEGLAMILSERTIKQLKCTGFRIATNVEKPDLSYVNSSQE
jgi:hypothetical protein